MNNEDLLFTNTFVDIPDSQVPLEGSSNNFRKYYESSIKSRKSVELNPAETSIALEDISRKIEKKTIITIDTKDRDTNQYPLQNDFAIFLGKTFFNVKSIALVSTEIPNTDTVIKELPSQLKNNSIIWINEEDKDLGIIPGCTINTSIEDVLNVETSSPHGIPENTTRNVLFFNGKKDSEASISGFLDGEKEVLATGITTLQIKLNGGNPFQGTTSLDVGQPVYSVDIKPGNYTASTLVDQISSTLNKVRRLNGAGQFHYFEVTVNLDTDVILFDSVKLTQLPNNSISTTAASTVITVSSAGHGFKTGDRVKMLGVKNLAGIPGSVLRGDFIVSVVDFNTFTYEITERAIETASGGGNVVKTGKNAPFRLLFNSEDTRIQFNTGFPDEDSSVSINSNNPILTKSLSITNAVLLPNEIIRITTSIAHSLEAANSGIISSITSDLQGGANITTSVPHNIDIPQIIFIRDTNSQPSIDGDYLVIPTGPTSFSIKGRFIVSSGNYGEFLFGGDTVQISSLKTSPPITASNYFHIENVPANNVLDIKFPASLIETNSVSKASVNTEQITVTHPNHGFNKLVLVDPFDSELVVCKTLLPNNLVGSIRNNLAVVSGPVATNTIDITIPGHGLETSDSITIRNSTCTPTIDGIYIIQVLGLDTVRINFVFATLVPGTCSVISGDKISISKSNSIPRINGNFSISNKEVITSISTGSISVSLTLSSPRTEWRVGDLITLSNTNCVPNIDGEHYILSGSGSTFTVNIDEVVVTPGTRGDAVNKSRFLALTQFPIIVPGNTGIFGRDQEISFYRVAPEVKIIDNIGGILINSLNARPREILRIIDPNTYVIRVKGSYANKTVSSGGNGITVSSKLHGNRSIQANTRSGDQETALFRSVSLQGEDYLFLSSQGLDTVVNSSAIPDVFAKILLNDSPGNMVYNSFITAPKIFQSPLSKIDTLRFKMLTSKGYPFNFNDINWSFSLEVIELVDSLINSEFSSRSNNTEYDGAAQGTADTSTKRRSLTRSGKSGSLDTASTQFGVLRAAGGRGGAATVIK
jgi:hypothetical protein